MVRSSTAFVGAAAAVAAAESASVLLAGCNSLQLDSEGFAADADAMPMSQIGGAASVLYSVTSAEACREKCQAASPECAYFTFRESKATGEKVCILRPGPSLAAAPLFQVRVFDDAALFRYTSGPANPSSDACIDGQELVSGCGGSAPASCAMLGKHVAFNATCLSDADLAPSCGVQGFSCCVDCDAAGAAACCGRDSRLEGWLLTGGTAVGGWPSGIRSAEECWSRCYAASGCSHWNFVTSENSAAVYGGCYLRGYEQLDSPQYVKAPAFVTSVVGGSDCEEDHGLQAPAWAEDESTATGEAGASSSSESASTGLGGQPIAGTCFESGVDVIGANVYQQWGVAGGEECQTLCQQWSGCRGFVYDPAHTGCYLKSGWSSKSLATDEADVAWRYITGPRDCPGAAAAAAPEGEAVCVFSEQDIQLEDLVATPAGNLYECWQKCTFWEGCHGWTFFEEQCYLKAGVEPRVKAEGVVSGAKDGCSWPVAARRRVLGNVERLQEQVAAALHRTQEKTTTTTTTKTTVTTTVKVVHPDRETREELKQMMQAMMLAQFQQQQQQAAGAESTAAESTGSTVGEPVEPVVESTDKPKKSKDPVGLPPHFNQHGEKQHRSSEEEEEEEALAEVQGVAAAGLADEPAEISDGSPIVPRLAAGPESTASESTAAESSPACVHKNRDVEATALETVGGIDSGVACQRLCAAREDCFLAAYTPVEQLCAVHYEGELIARMGTDVYERGCETEEESAAAEEASTGHSYHFLGSPSEWSVKGEVPDFGRAREWDRLALLVMTGDEEDCFVSDVLVNVNSCWEKHEKYLPLDVQLQVVGVARGRSFPGWPAIDWEGVKVGDENDGLLELFNRRVQIAADGDSLSGGHGVWISELTDELTSGWPASLANFRTGSFYARLRAFGKRGLPARLVFCVTGSDQPLSEMCSFPLVVPPQV